MPFEIWASIIGALAIAAGLLCEQAISRRWRRAYNEATEESRRLLQAYAALASITQDERAIYKQGVEAVLVYLEQRNGLVGSGKAELLEMLGNLRTLEIPDSVGLLRFAMDRGRPLDQALFHESEGEAS